MRAVEGETTGLQLGEAATAMGTGEVLGEEKVLRRGGRDIAYNEDSVSQLQGRLCRVGQPGAKIVVPWVHRQPVHHRLNGMHLVAVEDDLFIHIAYHSIHPHTHIASLSHILEHALMVSLAILNQGSQDHDAGTLRQVQHRLYNLRR